jgi:hypothetical protein
MSRGARNHQEQEVAVASKVREVPKEYEIVDPLVKPDAAGTLGGVVIVEKDGKKIVRMTRAQAQWYLDHGTIRAVSTGTPATQ